MNKLNLSSLLLCGFCFTACSTTQTAVRPDGNGDGRVTPDENIQYTRKLTVVQNHKASSNRSNVADVNSDSRIDDLEWAQYQQRQQAIDANSSGSGTSSGLGGGFGTLDKASRVLGTVNMIRGLGGF